MALRVLFWGRYGNYGPNYPRNRVVAAAFTSLGHQVKRFVPRLSIFADLEYPLTGGEIPDLIWVPSFRHRDLPAAYRYACRHAVPLIFDPLISAYDKQVNERKKFAAASVPARKLREREERLFKLPDLLVADTEGHRAYFSQLHQVPTEKIVVVPVGAEEELFRPALQPSQAENRSLEVVFFGTFIGLHGIQVVIEAAAKYNGPALRWRLLGEGPLRGECEKRVAELKRQYPDLDIEFEGWRPIDQLPARLEQADIILGIFGTSDKALRVIPNKVYQGLALGRPVVTAESGAYPPELLGKKNPGLVFVSPGDPAALAAALERLASTPEKLSQARVSARRIYETYFSQRAIQVSLLNLLQKLGLDDGIG